MSNIGCRTQRTLLKVASFTHMAQLKSRRVDCAGQDKTLRTSKKAKLEGVDSNGVVLPKGFTAVTTGTVERMYITLCFCAALCCRSVSC